MNPPPVQQLELASTSSVEVVERAARQEPSSGARARSRSCCELAQLVPSSGRRARAPNSERQARGPSSGRLAPNSGRLAQVLSRRARVPSKRALVPSRQARAQRSSRPEHCIVERAPSRLEAARRRPLAVDRRAERMIADKLVASTKRRRTKCRHTSRRRRLQSVKKCSRFLDSKWFDKFHFTTRIFSYQRFFCRFFVRFLFLFTYIGRSRYYHSPKIRSPTSRSPIRSRSVRSRSSSPSTGSLKWRQVCTRSKGAKMQKNVLASTRQRARNEAI